MGQFADHLRPAPSRPSFTGIPLPGPFRYGGGSLGGGMGGGFALILALYFVFHYWYISVPLILLVGYGHYLNLKKAKEQRQEPPSTP